MDEKPDQIIGHIEAQRHELGRNLNELETRVRATTNWRTYFEKNPGLAMGAALGGGLLLGVMASSKRHHRTTSGTTRSSYAGATAATSGGAMGLKSSSSSPSSSRTSMASSPVTSMQLRQVSETMDHIKAAMIAFGIAKAKEFLAQAIPGLDTHLTDAEQRGRQHSSGPGSSQTWQSSASPSSPIQRPGDSHSWQSAGAHQEPSPVTF